MRAALPASRRLSWAMRLHTQRDFARIKREGRRLIHGCLIANWLPLPPDSLSQVGLVTSRKLGPAVTRNRARRLLREVFRLHRQEFRQPLAVVLVARSSIVHKQFAAVERDYLQLLRRAGLLKAST